MDFKTLRQTAKQHLEGKWGVAIMASVIVGLVINGPNFLIQSLMALGPAWGLLASLLSIVTLLLMPMQIGLIRVFLDFVEGKDVNLDRVFYGFKHGMYGRNLGVLILMSILIVLWALLLVIPAIIKAMAYAMTPYILADPKYNRVASGSVITISRRLMDGNKLRLFGIQLYYTWWYVITMSASSVMLAFDFEPEISYAIWGISTVIYTFYTTPLLQSVTTTFYKSISTPPNPPASEGMEESPEQPLIPPRKQTYDPLSWDYEDDWSDHPKQELPPQPEEPEDKEDEDDPFFY